VPVSEPSYVIVYSDGVTGAALPWAETLALIRRRLHAERDSYRERGVVPARVVRAS